MQERFKQRLDNAVRSLQIADHMVYVTYPLLNEKRLILKIFNEIYQSIIGFIEAILEYDYLYKRINLYQNQKDNLETFFTKSFKNYDITHEQLKKIKEIFEIYEKHKQSSMEFVRKERVIILGNNLKTEFLDILKIKEQLLLAKQILIKIKSKINVF